MGYKRDRKRKGYLIVDEKESDVVQAIFETYVKEKSVRRTTDLIRTHYEGLTPKLKKIAPSKVYGILTNKAYIGIRTINKHDKAEYEEVKAVWENRLSRKSSLRKPRQSCRRTETAIIPEVISVIR